MNYSTDINQWDYSTICKIVTLRDAEPGFYDFKEVLHATIGTETSKKDHNDSIRKVVCSMANTDGGYIIFGVKDAKKNPNLKAEQRIVGIPKSSEYLKEFGEKIASIQRHVPCVYPDKLIDIEGNDTHGVFVVHIPFSPLRPHMLEGTFYRRTATGNAEKMNWYEVRDQMLYTEGRLQKVRLLRLKIAQFQNQIRIPMGPQWEQELARNSYYDVNSFEIVLADVCDLIPFQTGLLEKLVKLAKTATDLNIIMNPITSFTSFYNRTSAEGEKTNLLSSLCMECEEQLTELFGPLTAHKT